MKKTVLITLLSAILATMLGAVPVCASSAYKWLYEDFENSDISHIATNGATISRVTDQTCGGSAGALHVSVSQNYGSAIFGINMESGKLYKMSVWIKMNGTLPKSDELHFIYNFKEDLGNGNTGSELYTDVKISNAKFSVNEWKYYETTYTHDGKGTKVGTGGQRFKVIQDGTAAIRVGNGLLSDTDGVSVDYFMDDFVVEPVAQESGLVKNGSFEYDVSNWYKSNASLTYVSGGADGTKGCAYVEETNIYGTVSQAVAIMPNKSYKLSFWAKSGDPAFVGKSIQIIIDRHAKVDANIKTYEYLLSGQTLNAEWTRYETIYKYSGITYETTIPDIYLRIGTGKEYAKYYFDEFSVEEVGGMVYNGDFEDGISGFWTKSNVSVTQSQGGANGTGYCVKIQETSNYGSLRQGVAVMPGHKYKISFWAKAESWNNQQAGEQLPITLIFDRYVQTPSANDRYTGPNYEYIPDNTNSQLMTNEWKYFEFEYNCNINTETYRVPMLSFRTGVNGDRRAVYYLDEIKIEPEDEVKVAIPQAKNIVYSGTLMDGQVITINYDYIGSLPQSGSMGRVLRSVDDNWITVQNVEIMDSKIEYVVGPKDVDCLLAVEIFPMDSSGAYGPKARKTLGMVTPVFSATASFITPVWDSSTDKIEAAVDFKNYQGSKNVIAVIALFNDKNLMCATAELSQVVGENQNVRIPLSIPVAEGAAFARVFVWDGTSSINTSMVPYCDYIQLNKQK